MIFSVVQSLSDYIDGIIEPYRDQRVKDWPMVRSPIPTLVLCVIYVYVCTNLGPKLMEKRKPFQLKKALIVYNAVQVVFSSYLVSEGIWWVRNENVTFRCDTCDFSNNPKAIRMAAGSWWYFMSKFVEFLDTIFFVLRKKNNQITTLHVFHHTAMPIGVWIGMCFYPCGHTVVFGILNSFVHAIMYSYYLLAALGPQYQKYLWWKKYLTTIQIVQFAVVFVHSIQLFFIDCSVPIFFAYFISLYAAIFLFLFGNFYMQSYVKGDTKMETVMRSVNFCTPGAENENEKSTIGVQGTPTKKNIEKKID